MMMTLLGLDARLLLRGWRVYAPAVLIAGIPAFVVLGTGENEGNLLRAAWIAGTAAVIGPVAWFILISQVERVAALAPLAPRLRALHHVVLAAAAALPTALIGGVLSDALRGTAAGLIVLFGLVLFSLVIDGVSRLPALPQGLIASALFFAPAGAVGAQILSKVSPALLALYAAATASLVLLHLLVARGLEYGTAYAWRNDVSRPPAARGPFPAGETGLLARHLRPARCAILFRAAWVRWPALLSVLCILILSCAPGAHITAALLLFMGMMWPLHIWKGFQAAPVPRAPAFLSLVGPLILVWFVSTALMAVGWAVRTGTDFVEEHPVAGVQLKGWDSRNHFTDVPGWGRYSLADDPSAAAWQTSALLRTSYGVSVDPAELLSLLPPGTEQTTTEWLQAVEDRYRPQIRRTNLWTCVLGALGLLLLVTFFAGIYLLPRKFRPLHSLLYFLGLAAVLGFPAILKSHWSHVGPYMRDVVMHRPMLWAAGLTFVFVLLIVRYAFAFRRIEPDNLAWLAKSN